MGGLSARSTAYPEITEKSLAPPKLGSTHTNTDLGPDPAGHTGAIAYKENRTSMWSGRNTAEPSVPGTPDSSAAARPLSDSRVMISFNIRSRDDKALACTKNARWGQVVRTAAAKHASQIRARFATSTSPAAALSDSSNLVKAFSGSLGWGVLVKAMLRPATRSTGSMVWVISSSFTNAVSSIQLKK